MAVPTIRRARRYCGWSLMSGVALSGVLPVWVAFEADGPYVVPAVAALVACSVLLVALARFWDSAPPWRLQVGTLLFTVAVWTVAAWHGQDPSWAMPAAVATGLVVMYQRGRRAGALALTAGSTTVATLAAGYLGAGRDYVDDSLAAILLITALATFSCVANDWVWQLFVELDEARQLAGELAVAQERLRFAADLHDIQGHTLQAIALKSELARRVVVSDPRAAAAQIGQVEELARQALADTRDLVHGYRDLSFAYEVSNAAEVLGAAGIDCTYGPVPVLPAPAVSLFGMVVREATTNILRHSTASTVSIDVAADGTRLTIRNDGVVAGSSGRGTGLLGLDQRLREHGGAVRATAGAGVFEVVAEIGDSA